MIIHRKEIMEPEELTQLGGVFDEAWAAVSPTAGKESAELRTALASILLRLANLKQLGPEQMKATALRLFRSEPVPELQAVAPSSEIDCQCSLTEEREGCSASAASPSVPRGA